MRCAGEGCLENLLFCKLEKAEVSEGSEILHQIAVSKQTNYYTAISIRLLFQEYILLSMSQLTSYPLIIPN